jgi:DNA primase
MGKRRDSIVFEVPTGKRRRNLKAKKSGIRWYNDEGTTKCLAKYGQGREVVLFESVIDAVSAHVNAGVTAWAASGAGAFPRNSLGNFRDHNIEQVYLCYDNDPNGESSMRYVAYLLDCSLQAKIYLIHLPPGIKDAGQYFASGYSGKDFRKLMAEAEDHNPKKSWVSRSQGTLDKFFEMQR